LRLLSSGRDSKLARAGTPSCDEGVIVLQYVERIYVEVPAGRKLCLAKERVELAGMVGAQQDLPAPLAPAPAEKGRCRPDQGDRREAISLDRGLERGGKVCRLFAALAQIPALV